MTTLSNKTLAEIVITHHRTAAVFEKHRLDFCCKGKRTLRQACEERNIPVDELENELGKVLNGSAGNAPAFPFEQLGLAQLADYIVNTHHEYVKKELPQIFAYIQKVASKHGERHPELYNIFEAVAAIKEEMEAHMQKEEMILFPRIKETEKLAAASPGQLQLQMAYLQSPITVMEQEHDHAGSLMEEIRKLTHNYQEPGDACTTYKLTYASLKAFETDLHQHVHLENNILFPKALELFRQLTGFSMS